MSLTATLPKAVLLKRVLESVKDLVVDANFDCSEDGIALQAMDSAHVSLVAMSMEADNFSDYKCSKRMQLGVKIESMSKILKCAGNEDELTLTAQEGAGVMKFTFTGKNKESEFELKLLQIESDSLTIPKTDYAVTISMSSAEFQRICRDMTILGETVVISADKEGVTFSTSGDIGKGSVLIKSSEGSVDDKEEATKISIEEPVELTFALRYLNMFTKATGLSTSVSLQLSKDVPLVVQYSIADVGWVRYYLAPKIDDD
eukprot:TRINITY_DN4842_c0_g1_i1.p1 TRINITY_DN4842_c0_g1~~TRINITY_DN4842_c0_g1_i1.p1  ORF type:complete len:280 (-),score=58.92 TRINITY_DN4842_c0_g1_i1:31-807(-)